MDSVRAFFGRHRRKILVSLGVAGGGYALYAWYQSQQRKQAVDVALQAEEARAADELVKNQLQTHYENIQRISDTTTLPYAMHYLRTRIMEELDLTHLTETLLHGKGKLTAKEKLETWGKLKILSFTRTACSLWAVTMLSLYVRVQVTILGRHLYLDIARGSDGTSSQQGEAPSVSKQGQQDFLATADFLSTHGINSLIKNMQSAATEVLKDKQLTDTFGTTQVQEALMEILESFMSMGEENSWINHLVPENVTLYTQMMAVSTSGFDDSSLILDLRKLDQLMLETRSVLGSPDFRSIVDRSLRKVVDVLIEDMTAQFGASIPTAGLPLAKLLPRVAQLSMPPLEEPSNNKFIQIIRTLPDVELFYTFLYANMPAET